ncbi:hypothetical protein ACFWIB_39960 [Streptomyces sp. NPDC127051]|uniref:hypothetical protein n=1 Tax=Streptomyces sp. NPDC127051 TaxID=3347119 RepID=UPI00365B86B1
MHQLLFFTAVIAAGSTSLALAIGLRKSLDVILAVPVFFTAQTALLVMAIGGGLHALSPGPLGVGAVTLTGLELAITLSRFRGNVRQSLGLAIDSLKMVTQIWRHPFVVITAALVAGQYIWRAALGFSFPMVDYDTLAYHLLGPVSWLQNGSLGHTPQNLFTDTYPDGQGLIVAWMGCFLGSIKFAWLAHIPFILMGIIAAMALARLCGASRSCSCLAGLVLAAAPSMYLEFPTGMVDIAAAATALSAIYFVMSMPEVAHLTGEGILQVPRHLAVAGWAVGLAVAVKSSNLFTAAFVSILAVAGYFKLSECDNQFSEYVEGQRKLRRISLTSVMLMIIPAGCLGGYWYVRTWLTYGNPFYPISILGFEGWGPVEEVLGVSETKNMPLHLRNLPLGWVGQTARSWWDDLAQRAFDYAPTTGGFGIIWIPLILPFAAYSFIALRRRKKAGGALTLTIFALLWMALSPAAWYGRMNLVVVGVGATLAAAGISSMSKLLLRQAVVAAMAGGIAVTMWWTLNPTYYSIADSSGKHQMMSLGDAWSHIRAGTGKSAKIEPVSQFSGLESSIPRGAGIAVSTPSGDQPYTFPLIGDRGQRRLIKLARITSVPRLREAMREKDAQYILVGGLYPDAPLLPMIQKDRQHFSKVAINGDLGGATLYKLGQYSEFCPDPVPRVNVALDHSNRATAVVTTSCRKPVTDDSVAFYLHIKGMPDRQVGQVELDGSGRGSIEIARNTTRGDTFIYARTRGNGSYFPGASSLVRLG